MGESIYNLEEFKNACYERLVFDSINDLVMFNIHTMELNRAAYTGNGLKEISSNVNVKIQLYANDFESILNRCKNEHHLPDDTSVLKLIEELKKDYIKAYKKYGSFYDDEYDTTLSKEEKISGRADIIPVIISKLKIFIKKVDGMIENNYRSIKLSKNGDNRLGEASIESTVKSLTDPYPWGCIEHEQEQLKKEGKDIFSEENMLLSVKKLRIVKSATISAFNKYFGRNSFFKELELQDIILK